VDKTPPTDPKTPERSDLEAGVRGYERGISSLDSIIIKAGFFLRL